MGVIKINNDDQNATMPNLDLEEKVDNNIPEKSSNNDFIINDTNNEKKRPKLFADPKMNKVIKIAGIITVVIIVLIIAFVLIPV